MSAERANAPLTREAVASVDVVIVGAGIAGLTAAWQLRDRAILVLESESRPGGRMLSRTSDGYWLNLGPHLFPGPTTVIGRLADDHGMHDLLQVMRDEPRRLDRAVLFDPDWR